MAKKTSPRIPKYRRQKRPGGADDAFVDLSGQRRYLGPYGSEQSKAAYRVLVAEWAAGGGQPPTGAEDITVSEICARFWKYANGYYRSPEGAPTTSLSNYQIALRPLKRIYGPTKAADFGPKALKTVRQDMIRHGWCRDTVNKMTGLIRRVFRWAVAEELVRAEVIQSLDAVDGLRRGRTEAPESEPIKPVPSAHIHAIEPHVGHQVWALVQLQLLTGARPGELVIMRPIDLDTTGRVWTYRPADHKTAHRGHERMVYLGPRGQELIRPFLGGRAVDAYMFSPIEAEAERRAKMHEARKTPTGHGNRPGTNRKVSPMWKPCDHYTTASYRRATERACRGAGVPVWTPHRLRHSAGTSIRKEFGLEAAQIMLGHKRADVTQVYAEINAAKAVEIAAKIG